MILGAIALAVFIGNNIASGKQTIFCKILANSFAAFLQHFSNYPERCPVSYFARRVRWSVFLITAMLAG